MTDKGAALQAACDRVIADPALAPEYDKTTGRLVRTHCNAGALHVAQAMGCREFDRPAGQEPMTADEMHAHMTANASRRWLKVDGGAAALHALDGGLGYAAAPGARLQAAHGHIAVVYPASRQWSGSLKKDVPIVANVGKEDMPEKATAAFPVALGEPDYFIWA